jgi:hypothetical protein
MAARERALSVAIRWQFPIRSLRKAWNPLRMGGRVVEGTGLENRQARKRLEGSNPSPSANLSGSFGASRERG